MNNFIISCLVILLYLFTVSCNQIPEESVGYVEKTDSAIVALDTVIVERKLKSEKDSLLFNPYYKPFYGGLTIFIIDKLYDEYGDGDYYTASGPGNPRKIDCYPNYSDSSSGSYHFYNPDEHCFDSDVFVSIWKKGFYGNDTTQRINAICIYDYKCKLNHFFPFQIGQKLLLDNDSLECIDSNIYLYRNKDYEFCILIQAEHIGAIFIKRLYCRNEKIDTNEIKGFKYTALGNIKSNIERRAQGKLTLLQHY